MINRLTTRKGTLTRGIVLLPLVAAALGPPIVRPVRAQDAQSVHQRSRTTVFTILGAILGGAAGLAIAKGSQSSGRHGCLGAPCVVVGSALIGAGVGFAIGHESDRVNASRYRGVAPLRATSISADLAGDPSTLDASDSAVAVGGSAGVQVFPTNGRLQLAHVRAQGLNGIIAVGIAPDGWMAVGSPEGLYMFPPGTGPGALVRPGSVSAVATDLRRVYVAVDNRVEVVPQSDDTTRDWPGLALSSPARALVLDSARALVWATTDRALFGLRADGDSLARVAMVPLEAAGLRIALSGDTVAVALGELGVRLFDISNAAAPRAVGSWTIAHFAYDVSIDKNRLFVAAGPEGVYVIDIGVSPMRTIGLARSLGFATALASRRGYTYILDRRGVVLRRVLSDF